MQPRLYSILLPLALLAGAASAQVGTLQGRVVLDGGQGLAGARVFAQKARQMGYDYRRVLVYQEPPFNAAAVSGPTGDFTIANLKPGRYSLCASGVERNHLDSCQWMQPPVAVEVSGGRTTSGAVVNIRSGVAVNFTVEDPGARLQTGRRLRIGVLTGGNAYYQAIASRISATQLSYLVAVPRGVPLRLFLDADVDVQNDAAQLVPNRTPGPAILLPATGDAAVRLTVR